MSVILQKELIHSIAHGNLTRVAELLDAGADVNASGGHEDCWTPLTVAAENEQLEIIKTLVERGADINRANQDGYTPLHVAVDVAIDSAVQADREEINWQVVRLLIQFGADPTVSDRRGETPLTLVRAYGNRAVDSFRNAFPDMPMR